MGKFAQPSSFLFENLELTTLSSSAETPHPNACCGWFAEVHGLPTGTQSHRFIVFALQHFNGRRGTQVQTLQKFQELLILLVNAQYFGRFLCAQIRQQYRSLLPQLGDSRSEEHTSELQSLRHLVCRLLLEKK